VEIEIISRKNNEFLHRVELEFKISHPNEASPKRGSVKSAIAKIENAKAELVVIDSMHTEYGHSSLKGFAKVYKNKEDALSLERKHILMRNGLIAAEKKEQKEKKPKPEPEVEKTESQAEKPAEERPKKEEKTEKQESKEAEQKDEPLKGEKEKKAKPAGDDSKK
jgi:ribosomal protein S24E